MKKTEYNGRVVSLNQLSELTGVDIRLIRNRYARGERGDALVRPVSRENTPEAIRSKKLFVHELWSGVWYFKGERVAKHSKNDFVHEIWGGSWYFKGEKVKMRNQESEMVGLGE